jgi:hypothetical protein
VTPILCQVTGLRLSRPRIVIHCSVPLRNLRAGPAVKVQIGRDSFTPDHQFLTDDEAFDVTVQFRREHSQRLRLVSGVLGRGDLRSDATVRQFIHSHPFMAFQPAASPTR